MSAWCRVLYAVMLFGVTSCAPREVAPPVAEVLAVYGNGVAFGQSPDEIRRGGALRIPEEVSTNPFGADLFPAAPVDHFTRAYVRFAVPRDRDPRRGRAIYFRFIAESTRSTQAGEAAARRVRRIMGYPPEEGCSLVPDVSYYRVLVWDRQRGSIVIVLIPADFDIPVRGPRRPRASVRIARGREARSALPTDFVDTPCTLVRTPDGETDDG